MKHQYAHTISTWPGTARCSLLHRRVYTSPSKNRPAPHVSGRGGDECCGRNLHRTGCRPLHDHEGSPAGRNERCPPSPSLLRLLRPGCASRRIASRCTCCTLRILHTKRIRTLNRRLSGCCWIILRERSSRRTTFPTMQRARDYRTKHGDCLLSARAEVVSFARRNAFALAVCYDAASCNYSFAKTQNSRWY